MSKQHHHRRVDKAIAASTFVADIEIVSTLSRQLAWTQDEIVQQAVGQLPWGHNLAFVGWVEPEAIPIKSSAAPSSDGYRCTPPILHKLSRVKPVGRVSRRRNPTLTSVEVAYG